ncbi:MAG: hypothetical protein HZC28_05225 [Spirochaetes bacterium]|nr:hypothetical protein [Spirochaetota bacterium]
MAIKMNYVLAACMLCVSIAAVPAEMLPGVNTGFIPQDITQFFITPEQPSKIVFSLKSGSMKPAGLAGTISDYLGANVGTETLAEEADGRYTLTVTLRRGFYELSFQSGERFGVVSLEPAREPDPFFGMDPVLTWIERRPAYRKLLVSVMSRCGIAIARERIAVGHIHSNLDSWDWNRNSQYEDLRGMYKEYRIPVLDVIHGAPEYNSGKKYGQPNLQWPQHQPDAVAMYRKMIPHYAAVWGGAEIQNEPDFFQRPGSYYAVQVKTASYAFATSSSAAPVVSGVTAFIPPGEWFDTCGENGMLDDSDVFSFHSYRTAPETESLVERTRAWVKKYGHESIPLWHTECGWAWPAGPSRPEQKHDMQSALEISAKAAESRACGVARYFPYIMVYQVLGKLNYGMMGQEVTPLRSMAAYAYCISALSGKDYAGDITGLHPSVRMARVFMDKKSDTATIVLYRGESTPGIAVPFPVIGVTGIDGRTLIPENGLIPIPDGMCYVTARTADIAKTLTAETSAMRLYMLGKNPDVRKRRASPVVLQLVEDSFPSTPAATKYGISRETARALSLRVKVNNLSGRELSVKGLLQLPAGGGSFPAESAVVAPSGSTEISWNAIDVSKAVDISEIRFLKIAAEIMNDDASLPKPSVLALPVVMDGTLDEYLSRHRSKKELPVTDLSRWTKNIAGGGSCELEAASGIWTMHVRFPKGDWSYPRFAVSGMLSSGDNGLLIRARIAKGARWVRCTAKTSAVDFWKTDLLPADGEWHVIYVPFTEFVAQGAGNANTRLEAAGLQTIELGMISNVPENTFEISRLIVVGD